MVSRIGPTRKGGESVPDTGSDAVESGVSDSGGGEHDAREVFGDGLGGDAGSEACSEAYDEQALASAAPRICRIPMKYLIVQNEAGVEVTEEVLSCHYLEQIEDEIQTEGQLSDQQRLVHAVIHRLNQDGAIREQCKSEDPTRPALRVLAVHPSFLDAATQWASKGGEVRA